MNNIIKKSLADIAEVSTGYHARGSVRHNPAGHTYVVQMKDIDNNNQVVWPMVFKADLKGGYGSYLLQKDDVLLVMRGRNFYGAWLPETPVPAVASNHFFRIRLLAQDIIRPDFLAWQLRQPPATRYYNTTAAGSIQLSLRKTDIEEMQIACPPLARQASIMLAVNSIMKDNELLNQRINNNLSLIAAIAERELL